MANFAKILIVLGVAFMAVGLGLSLVIYLGWHKHWPEYLIPGRLPGDIRIEGENGNFYFPLMTCVVISVFLSGVFTIFRKIFSNF